VGYLQPMDNVHHLSLITYFSTLISHQPKKEGLKGVSEAEPWFPLFPLLYKIEKNRIFKIKNIYTHIN
jgi:hypothetical protein